MSRPRQRTRPSALLLAGSAVCAVFVLVAVLAPAISPYEPRAVSGDSLEPPSTEHLLGTNNVGQDIASQLIWGSRTSLQVAVGASGLSIGIGVLFGVGAGLLGGTADRIAMRIVDLFLALPIIPLLIVVATLAGPSLFLLTVLIGAIGWPRFARVVRSQTLSLRSRAFVESARGFGGGLFYVIRKHLVPALGPLIITGLVEWGTVAIGLEAALAFFGLNDPGTVSWGAIVNQALEYQGLYFEDIWLWWLLPAGLAITVALIGFALVGMGLEAKFNPRAGRPV